MCPTLNIKLSLRFHNNYYQTGFRTDIEDFTNNITQYT